MIASSTLQPFFIMPSSTKSGIPPKTHNTRGNNKNKETERAQRLQELDETAKDGRLSPEKVEGAKAQLNNENSADSEQSSHSQTKPEYNALEGQAPYEAGQAKSTQ